MLNSNEIIVMALLIFTNNFECGMTALTGQCNECFSSGIACLDEQSFALCSGSIPTTIRTPCPSGSVCTANNNICLATSEGAVPVCYEDQCGVCASVNNNFACLSEQVYAFCFDGETPAISSITSCPLGYVCDLQNIQICSLAEAATPSCIPPTTSTPPTTESEADITTDTTTSETTTVTTTELSPITTSETSTETTTQITSDTTTNITTETITDSTTQTVTDASTTSETTTEFSTNAPTESASEESTASTTETTITTTKSPIDTTTTTTDTTSSSTVITTAVTTTTISTTAPKDPNTLCAEIAMKGNFRVDGDTTCSKYIYCYLLGGQYLGWEYSCRQYFNAATGNCQQTRPADC